MVTASVAMTAYNGEAYIDEQIQSILNQLGEDDELVISYDKSTDKTLEIIEGYAGRHPQVKVVMDPDSGLFSNFENAIANCSGDYIFISDQDDIWKENKIAYIVDLFKQTNADMIIHNGVHIDPKGEVISKDFFSMYNIREGLVNNFARPRYSGCCTAFNKKMKDMIIPIPRKVGAYDHWIGMIGELYGKLIFDSEILIEHRIHGANVTVTTRTLPQIIKSRWNLLKELIKIKNER